MFFDFFVMNIYIFLINTTESLIVLKWRVKVCLKKVRFENVCMTIDPRPKVLICCDYLSISAAQLIKLEKGETWSLGV